MQEPEPMTKTMAQDLKLLARLEVERNKGFVILDEMREAFNDVRPEEIEREVSHSQGRTARNVPCNPVRKVVLDTNIPSSAPPQ